MPEGTMSRHALAQCLAAGVTELGLSVSTAGQARMLDFLALLSEWNRSFNLTAVRDPGEMVVRHVLDSLAVLPYRRTGALLDVGAGAGLPGLVLAMADDSSPVTVVDSNGKKARFMREATRQLGLGHVQVLQARVEALDTTGEWPQIISRAFSDLGLFVRLAGKLLAPDGVMLAMKGRMPEDEMAALDPAWRVLAVHPLQVPGLAADRCLLELVRVDPTMAAATADKQD